MLSSKSSSDVTLRCTLSDSSRSEVNLYPCLDATLMANGQIRPDSKDESTSPIPVWMQCGLFPPKRLPVYWRKMNTCEIDGRVYSWMSDCEGLIEVYTNWNGIIKGTMKESQSARTTNMARFRELQQKHECVRMASIHSKTRVEVQREFMRDSSLLQM